MVFTKLIRGKLAEGASLKDVKHIIKRQKEGVALRNNLWYAEMTLLSNMVTAGKTVPELIAFTADAANTFEKPWTEKQLTKLASNATKMKELSDKRAAKLKVRTEKAAARESAKVNKKAARDAKKAERVAKRDAKKAAKVEKKASKTAPAVGTDAPTAATPAPESPTPAATAAVNATEPTVVKRRKKSE